ncbi:MAG: hypothetical protein L0387_43690 [Acidobacteria bacterium]|nr:hypothetical protein [Acidobacteriota bacterium]MCI0628486.1 hypothetical protein [Acidobacteriota bacterium]MCI0719790.1 hypothetical protein [Acidobacteriota bacterium]
MSKPNTDEEFFSRLSANVEPAEATPIKAPSRLKAKVYSALVRCQTASGPLLTVSASEANGRSLCVFEKAVEILPVGDGIKSLNFCRVCHARIAAEKMENAPIFWLHCPYAEFQNR